MSFRVTYATMSADDADLHDGYDRGIQAARARLGESHPLMIDGEARPGGGEHEERSPIDHELVLGGSPRPPRRMSPTRSPPPAPLLRPGRLRPGRREPGCCATLPTSSATSASSWRR